MSNQQPGDGQQQDSKAIVKGPQKRLNDLKSLFERAKGSIAAVVPKHLTPERLIKIATSAASRNPDLLDCSSESVLLAVVQAATIGLEPNTPLHHCALVPFKNKHNGKKEAQLVIEYRGLLQLAYQSGEVTVIYADVINANDEWAVEKGTNKRLYHKPCVVGDPGPPVAFYAVVKFKHGGDDFCFMTKAQVDKIRDAAPGKDSDAWVNHYEEQGKKTAVRRLSKTMPMSQDKSGTTFARAANLDDTPARDDAEMSAIIDVLGETVDENGEVTQTNGTPSRTDAMKDRLEAKAAGA